MLIIFKVSINFACILITIHCHYPHRLTVFIMYSDYWKLICPFVSVSITLSFFSLSTWSARRWKFPRSSWETSARPWNNTWRMCLLRETVSSELSSCICLKLDLLGSIFLIPSLSLCIILNSTMQVSMMVQKYSVLLYIRQGKFDLQSTSLTQP